MSNSMVGTIYQKIMDDVIENCVVTFEEDGVERRLLDEVKKTWQTKLSERKVAIMPWDPAPAPAPKPAAAPETQSTSVPATIPKTEPTAPNAGGAAQSGALPNSSTGPAIKAEPGAGGYDLQNLPQTNGVAPTYNTSGAALDRTSQQLHDKFGAAAGPQISQLQARRAMMNQNAPVQTQASQADIENKRRMYEMQQAQRHQQQMAQQQQQQQQQQQRPVGSAQTDGPSDWQSLVAERRAAAEADGGFADTTLREQLEASSKEMEGGGLFLPLKDHKPTSRVSRHQKPHPANAQFDGPGDGDDDGGADDEDAINSDLDDPEEDLDQDETDEDANQGEIMLCTYDKVQRVKNKWKCILKDGVLTTGGKEYVFHKANGDFEW